MRARRPRHRRVEIVAAVAGLLVAGFMVASCSSGASTAAQQGRVPARQCTEVADVLSDGPTVGADPVGYAEAQVLPLEQLKLHDRPLERAVRRLSAAYKAYSDSNGSRKAGGKVTAAEKRVDAICPKVAP